MKLTIIRADNLVIVDGRGLTIDCGSLPTEVAALQWNGRSGEIEYNADRLGRVKPNKKVTSLHGFDAIVSRFNRAAELLDNPPPPPPPSKDDLKGFARTKRYELETSGITWQGHKIATDDRSKMMILGAVLAAQLDPTWDTMWQPSDDNPPFELGPAGIADLAGSVQQHVNRLFGIYSMVAEEIDAGRITTREQAEEAMYS